MTPDDLRSRMGIKEDFRVLFTSTNDDPERGRRVLEFLMKQVGVVDPIHTTSVDRLFIKEGQQNIVFSILRQVYGSDDALARMILEVEKERLETHKHATS